MIAQRDMKIAEELKSMLLADNGEKIKRLILYGSRAKDNAQPDSDFDFLVIESGPVSGRDEVLRPRRLLSGLPYSVDVWVMSEEEFEETKSVIGGMAYPAHKYGVVLYENR